MEIFWKFLISIVSLYGGKRDEFLVNNLPMKQPIKSEGNFTSHYGLLQKMEEMVPFQIVKYCTNKYLEPKCVEIPNGSNELGKVAEIFGCAKYQNRASMHQTWYAHNDGVFNGLAVQIKNAKSGLCLGVIGNPETDGTPVGQVACDQKPFASTYWGIDRVTNIQPNAPSDARRLINWGGGCLSVKTESLDNLTPMVVYNCGFNYQAQQFRIEMGDFIPFYVSPS